MPYRTNTIGERRLLSQHRKILLNPAELRSGTASRRRAWLRVTAHMAVVVALLCLAVANLQLRWTWSEKAEMEDGVLWELTAANEVTALEVAKDSPAARAGIRTHDVLVAISRADTESPSVVVKSPDDVITALHEADASTRLIYSVLREGETTFI